MSFLSVILLGYTHKTSPPHPSLRNLFVPAGSAFSGCILPSPRKIVNIILIFWHSFAERLKWTMKFHFQDGQMEFLSVNLKNTPTPNPINKPQCLTCGNPIQDYRLTMVKTLPPTPKSSPSNYTKPVPIKIFYPISTSFPRKANPYFRIFSFGIPFARSAVS